MTQPERTAKALRTIDTQAAEARRELHGNGSDKAVLGYLLAIQQTAQTALQDALEAIKVHLREQEAFDGLLAACDIVVDRLSVWIPPTEDAAYSQIEAAIAKAKECRAPGRPVASGGS